MKYFPSAKTAMVRLLKLARDEAPDVVAVVLDGLIAVVFDAGVVVTVAGLVVFDAFVVVTVAGLVVFDAFVVVTGARVVVFPAFVVVTVAGFVGSEGAAET